jgi:hypothetical protein
VQKNNKKPVEALHEIKIEGVNGNISFDERGESNIPLVVVKAEKGAVEEIK